MSMIATSTKSGAAVAAFPDVCKTPTSTPALLAVAYPTGAAGATATKTPTATKTSGTAATTQTQTQLKSKLSTLHGQIASLGGTDPNRWHTLLDEYVITAAALYTSLAGGFVKMEGQQVTHMGSIMMRHLG